MLTFKYGSKNRCLKKVLQRPLSTSSTTNTPLSPAIPKHKQLTLYVHWPYCKSICPYCDFNRYLMPADLPPNSISTPGKKQLSHKEIHSSMRIALLSELKTSLEAYSQDIPLVPNSLISSSSSSTPSSQMLKNVEITSIFFGGGTPSLAEPETLAAIINFFKTNTSSLPNIEITMEANPTSIETSKLLKFKEAGVNRLSMGIQALNSEDLTKLGRNHSYEDALASYESARSIFDKVSFDLIYGRHLDQSVEMWKQELNFALSLKPNHLSLYQLTFEPGTPYYKSLKEVSDLCVLQLHLKAPSLDLQAELYEATLEETSKAGLVQYEVSNFAKGGHESIHNMNYWLLGDYLGIGPGAASRLTLHRSPSLHSPPVASRWSGMAIKAPEKWKSSVEQYGHGILEFTELSKRESIIELLLTGLRTTHGVSLDKILEITTNKKVVNDETKLQDLGEYLNTKEVEKLLKSGLLIFDSKKKTIRTSASGLILLDTILEKIIV